MRAAPALRGAAFVGAGRLIYGLARAYLNAKLCEWCDCFSFGMASLRKCGVELTLILGSRKQGVFRPSGQRLYWQNWASLAL